MVICVIYLIKNTMKNLIFLVIAIFIISCTSVKEIGQVNMISNRNVSPKIDYDLKSSYAGNSNKELKKSKAESIQVAIDNTVKKIPGGEFLMNVHLYSIGGKYYAATGDVWGMKDNDAYRGFNVGDKVVFKKLGKYNHGVVSGIKSDKSILIDTEDGKTINLKYDQVTRSE